MTTLVGRDDASTLIVCDIEGLLFQASTPSSKLGVLFNQELARTLQNHHQKQDKILYVSILPIPLIFWEKSLINAKIPLNNCFSLSNEIFMGFDGLQPSCRKGIVLCQGHIWGEVLSIVINQLWIRAQLQPKHIIYYTANPSHGAQLKSIAERIGAQAQINMMQGAIVIPHPAPTIANKSITKPITKVPAKTPPNPASKLLDTPTKELPKKTRVQVIPPQPPKTILVR